MPEREARAERPGIRFSPRRNRAAEIPWREWGPDAFAAAREAEKPVFLSISATWCHWCHVMDETTFSDAEVIRRLSEDFITVRVDTDMRPDVNRRYNQGGWPSVSVLTPDGDVMVGASYIPANQMLELLEQVARYWLDNRAQLAERPFAPSRREPPLQGGNLNPDIRRWVLDRLIAGVDRQHGGIGTAPKFPQVD
ncbi:MAG: DUF255 domain-containing protein, partial [Candidatus Geothermincolia bacterium]